jgi:hypothetical protein
MVKLCCASAVSAAASVLSLLLQDVELLDSAVASFILYTAFCLH